MHLVLVSAVFVGACAERAAFQRPVGESSVMSSSAATTPVAAPAEEGDAGSAPERYLSGKGSGPCAMDTLPTIPFAPAATEPDPAQTQELQRIAACLSAPPWETASVVLVGYTDVEGAFPANLELGLHRSQAVMRQLLHGGIAPGRIVVASAGELQRPSARWGFRAHRVEILIARGGPPRANEEPIARGIEAEGLLPRPRATATASAPARPPPAPAAAPARTAPRPSPPR